MQGGRFSKESGAGFLPFGVYRLGRIFQLIQAVALGVSHWDAGSPLCKNLPWQRCQTIWETWLLQITDLLIYLYYSEPWGSISWWRCRGGVNWGFYVSSGTAVSVRAACCFCRAQCTSVWPCKGRSSHQTLQVSLSSSDFGRLKPWCLCYQWREMSTSTKLFTLLVVDMSLKRKGNTFFSRGPSQATHLALWWAKSSENNLMWRWMGLWVAWTEALGLHALLDWAISSCYNQSSRLSAVTFTEPPLWKGQTLLPPQKGSSCCSAVGQRLGDI